MKKWIGMAIAKWLKKPENRNKVKEKWKSYKSNQPSGSRTNGQAPSRTPGDTTGQAPNRTPGDRTDNTP